MRINADIAKCQGYGNCVALDGDHFDLDDDGMVVVLQDTVTAAQVDATTEAVRSCPVSAIWLVNDDA
ncbi:ferredoxin [Micromonospora sp. NBC_00389]|uniref:ferredoxin n=1 Tax=Micromonospora sp. NBC_00389 TaxID=2903586 RepID=UPI002E1E40DF